MFTIRYHPDDKNSEGAERIRNALRQRGFTWDEIAESKDTVWGVRMETVLETPFYPSYTHPDQVEDLLSHISVIGNKCMYDGKSAKELNDQYLLQQIPIDE